MAQFSFNDFFNKGRGRGTWPNTGTGNTAASGQTQGNTGANGENIWHHTGDENPQAGGSSRKKKNGAGRAKSLWWVVLLLFAVIALRSTFYNVSEQQNAVVTMFGNVIRTDTAGLHMKIPFLQTAHMVDMTTHGVGIGYTIEDGQNVENVDDGIMITSDFNFVDIDFYLEYKVSDPVAYIYNSEEPELIMRNITQACIRNTVSNYPVDDVMTTGKAQIQADVKEAVTAALAEQNIGLQMVNISVQDAEPPTDTIVSAFKAVETAKQGKETAINNANKYQNQQIPAAEAEADKIRQDAEAKKESRVAEAEGQVERFNEMYEQYAKYPLITKQRLFYETMEDVLPDLKVIITDGKTETMLPLGSFSANEEAADSGTQTVTDGEEE